MSTSPSQLTRYEEMVAGLLAAFAAPCTCRDVDCDACTEDNYCADHEATCAACIAEDTLYVLGGSDQTTDALRAKARALVSRWNDEHNLLVAALVIDGDESYIDWGDDDA